MKLSHGRRQMKKKCSQCKKEYPENKEATGCPKCAPGLVVPESEFGKPVPISSMPQEFRDALKQAIESGEVQIMGNQMRERIQEAKPQFSPEQLAFARENEPTHLFHGKDVNGYSLAPMLFNPYTGEARSKEDIESDPNGILITQPGAPILAAKKEKTGWMCRTDFEHELGNASGGVVVYPDLEDLMDDRRCIKTCGYVQVTITEKKEP